MIGSLPSLAPLPLHRGQTTAVSTYDRYNWDGSKTTEILGQTVTDEQLAGLHRAGIAREYDLYGTSATSSSTGSG